MKCPRCQPENPPQAKFCLECATPLGLRCVSCGTQLPTGAKFCFECATPVSAPGSLARFASPEIYTPKHPAERMINSKAALEGERKQVTVLFAASGARWSCSPIAIPRRRASSLYCGTDKREQTQEHLTNATAMYREMGMTYWLEKAEAEMGELG